MDREFFIICASLALQAAALTVAAIAAMLLTPASRLFTDAPGGRKVHQQVISRAGGVCVVFAFLCTVLTWRFLTAASGAAPNPLFFNVLIFMTACITIIGLVDDIVLFSISNGAKFLLEMIVAWVITGLAGITLTEISIAGNVINLGFWGVPLSMIWIVGVANAINLIDGIDGLAATIVIIILTALVFLSVKSGAPDAAVACLIVIGAVIGFLIFNRSPARLFLGDMGSLFLGMFIGTMSIYVMHFAPLRGAALMLPLLIGVPLLDVTSAMARRYARKVLSGTPWYRSWGAMFKPDNEHMHHRLVQRGLTHNQAVLVLALFSSTLTFSAVVLSRIPQFYSWFAITYIGGVVFAFLHTLEFFDRPVSVLLHRLRPVARSRRKGAHRIAVVELDPVLDHALHHFDQDHFIFEKVDRESLHLNNRGFHAVILSADSKNGKSVWHNAHRLSLEMGVPVVVVSDNNEPAHTTLEKHDKAQSESNPHVVIIARPVYVPVLLSRLEITLHKGLGEELGRIIRDTGTFSRALINQFTPGNDPS